MSSTLLETRNLSKRYGSTHALEDLSLTARRGEILGLIGPNGAGKTTAIRMLVGLLPASSGEILIDGVPIGRTRGKVGYCPQQNALYPELTAMESLEFQAALNQVTGEPARATTRRLLHDLGLSDRERARPHQMSGGMQRRLAVALATANESPVVVLDEPEAGLDPHSRVLLRAFLRDLAKERAVIVTSHDLAEVDRTADRVMILHQGRTLAEGRPIDLARHVPGGERLEIETAGPAPRLPSDQLQGDFHVTVEGRTIRVSGAHLMPQVSRILHTIEAAGSRVRGVRYEPPTLETVFLHLTGGATA